MTRSFLSITLALATATAIFLGADARPAPAQSTSDATTSVAHKPKQYPEAQEALNLLLYKHDMPGAIKKFDEIGASIPSFPRPTS